MDELAKEVADYMGRREADYLKLHEDVLRDLYRFKDRSALSGSIYRIYSRADKQLNARKLKTEEGIVKTIRRWRSEKPNTRIHELHDIVGITVVTYFDSEIPRVVEALKKVDPYKGFFNSFDFVATWRKPAEDERKQTGYFAHHVKVASRLAGPHPPLCEIQVKSLLNDGWAAKTHDLVYKPKGKIDPEIVRQVEVIGGMVNALEQMSDGLRILITRNLEIDKERRATAISKLQRQTLESAKDGTRAEVSWYNALVKDVGHFTTCDDNDPKLHRLVSRWRDKVGAKPSQMGCRLLLLLALLRRSPGAANDAFEAIDWWTKSLTKPDDLIKAGRFSGTAHWALGQHDQAIESCRRVVHGGMASGLVLVMTKVDLAYYLAERSFIQDGDCSTETAEEIASLIEGWERVKDDRKRMSLQDSVGAIKIMTAPTADEVFEGRQMCSESRKWAVAHDRDMEVFEDFYRLHTERARRRIQELPTSPQELPQ